MSDEILNRVKSLIAQHRIVTEEELSADMQLADDLRIDGDDAWELIEAFCEEFEIEDMSDFDFSDYFNSEGCSLIMDSLRLLYRLLFTGEKPRKLIPVTIGDLARSAEAKRWIRPEVQSEDE